MYDNVWKLKTRLQSKHEDFEVNITILNIEELTFQIVKGWETSVNHEVQRCLWEAREDEKLIVFIFIASI